MTNELSVLIEKLLDNAATASQVRELCRDNYDEEETPLREAVRMNVAEPLRKRIAALETEVEQLRAKPCPHVVTSDEGTQHCNLAESSVRELKAQLAAATARADALREALREQTVVLDPMAWKADAKWCELCCTGWIHPGPERHAPGCLAALAEQEKPR